MMASCKLCGEEKKLVKAHIIPEALYAPMFAEDRQVYEYSSDGRVPPKRRLIGVYDEALVCGSCEDRFKLWDQTGIEYVRSIIDRRQKASHRGVVGYRMPPANYERLKMFWLSLLWRGIHSSHDFFKHVNCGEFHNRRVHRMVSEGNPGSPDEYAAYFAVLDDPMTQKLIYNPGCFRWEGLWLVQFWFHGVELTIKTDSRPMPDDLRQFTIKPGAEQVVPVKHWEGGKLQQVVFNSARQRRATLPPGRWHWGYCQKSLMTVHDQAAFLRPSA